MCRRKRRHIDRSGFFSLFRGKAEDRFASMRVKVKGFKAKGLVPEGHVPPQAMAHRPVRLFLAFSGKI